MFESDDWTFEDVFNDIDEKTIQSHFRCQNEEETPSVKRRKVDSCKTSSLPIDNNSIDIGLDIIMDTEDNNPPSSSKSDVSRGDLLLGIFQESTSQETFDFVKGISKSPSNIQRGTQCFQSSKTDIMKSTLNILQHSESKQEYHVKSMNEVESAKEVKLIRIFPGPAGLVSGIKNDNTAVVSYLNNMKELETKTATKHIEIKSQDEKSFFEERAWKLLLDDLPNNFLNEYRISTIKNKANANHCDSMKVKFIAGVLDYIDYSHDDPFIILKDSTGSIEGTIHRDIPLSYPGILEPNVVIFLRDVGLLKTTTYIVMNKYHILISRVNLLAIYSNKGQIMSTSHMKSILSNISDIELNRDYCMPIFKCNIDSGLQRIDKNCDNTSLQISSSINTSTNNYEFKSMSESSLHGSNKKYENHEQIFKKDNTNCKVTEQIFEQLNYSMDMNDVLFPTDCEFITSGEQNCLNRLSSETISQISKMQRCELQTRDRNRPENTKKELVINSQNKINEQRLPKILQKCIADVNTRQSRENCLSSYNDIAYEAHRDLNSSIKFPLPTLQRNVENSKTLASYFTDDNEYDSDDEILSQLDVDKVFNNPKKEC